MVTAIHVTHEAVQKMGGIGTVLHGLITSKKCQRFFDNTLLYTPLFTREGDPALRLGRNSEKFYSGLDGYDAATWRERFAAIEEKNNIRIVYGKKRFFKGRIHDHSTLVDIVAVDIWDMRAHIVNQFKYDLWKNFGIASDRFGHDNDYEQYLRIGVVLLDIFEAIYGKEEKAIVFSHEYMGIPSALAFKMEENWGRRKGDKTIFYAHEVSTARAIVEKHHGHDLSFYNVLNYDRDAKIPMEETFGSYAHYSRNELVKRAASLDHVFAVSDITKEEFLYLCPWVEESKVKVVYNGIPIEKVDYRTKQENIDLIKQYCVNLFDFAPDYIFTHVTRLVTSKALWRDVRLLHHVDEHFSQENLRGFFIILSTVLGSGRPPESVHRMEGEYGWPVTHREGYPDLVGAEVNLYRYLEQFNARSKAIKAVFINQFGFNKEFCGNRLPDGTSILGLRLGSDVEFGLSIYEPFGIAQLETLPYGGVPVISSTCGSSKLLEKFLSPKDFLVIDFTRVPVNFREVLKNKEDFLRLDFGIRDQVETEVCSQNAYGLVSRLPKNDTERKAKFNRMQKESNYFDWEHVAERVVGYLNSST